jgi:tetratricopeptide (TPR) repeat protein
MSLNPESWSRVRRVFEAALDQAEEERGAFVARAAGDDIELRAFVERMLDAHERPSDRLDPPAPFVELARAPLTDGETIDSFRIVRAVAKGGMGAVYEAVQEPLGRRVALKTVLFPSSATETAHRRFHYEGELLARLSHPNIAQIHASGVAGSADDPLPWIAMEFVEGARDLLRYSVEGELGREERLELFLQVCDAVGYAHERGVLHRDLKPSNLLVDELGSVKLIDFGIARAAESGQPLESTLTRTGELVGTLRYISPEQLRGDRDGGVRSEVYALGVVLHELLTGSPPVDVTGLPITAAIDKLAGDVRVQPRANLPHELRWILQRALERDPRRRYASTVDLAEDIARHRAGNPVQAAPPGSLYLLRKFVVRHRTGVGAALAVSLAVIGGGAAAGWGWFESRQAHALTVEEQGRTKRALEDLEVEQRRTAGALELAQLETRKLRAANAFLFDAVESAELFRGGRDLKVADLLNEFAEGIDRAFADQPAVATGMYSTIARAQRSLGLFDDARRIAERGLAREQSGDEIQAVETHILEAELALALSRVGELAEAERLFDAAEAGLEGHEDLAPLSLLSVRRGRAELLELQGRIPESTALKREALALSLETFGADDANTIETRVDLALSLSRQTEHEEARALAEESVARAAELFEEESARTLIYRHNLATILGRANHFAAGVKIYEELLPMLENVLGPRHDQLADAYNNYAVDLIQLQRLDDAAIAFARAIEIADHVYGPGSSRAQSFRGNLAAIYAYLGEYEDARDCYAELVDAIRTEIGYHPDLVTYLSNLSWIETELGDYEAAIAVAEDAVATGEEHSGPDHPVLAPALSNLAQALAADGQTAAAVEVYDRLLELEGALLLGDGVALADYSLDLADLLVQAGRSEDAVPRLEDSAAVIEDRFGENDAARRLRNRAGEIRGGR